MTKQARPAFLILGFLFCHSVIHFVAADEPQTTVIGVILPADADAARAMRLEVVSALAELEHEGAGPALRLAYASVVRGGDPGDEAGASWSGRTAADAAVHLVKEDGAAILIGPPGRRDAHLVAQIGGKTRTPVLATCETDRLLYVSTPWVVFPEAEKPGEFDRAPEEPPASAARRAIELACRAIRVAAPGVRGRDLLEVLRGLVETNEASGEERGSR